MGWFGDDYKCRNCGHKFTADDAHWIDEDNDSFPTCPKCASENVEAYFGCLDEDEGINGKNEKSTSESVWLLFMIGIAAIFLFIVFVL